MRLSDILMAPFAILAQIGIARSRRAWDDRNLKQIANDLAKGDTTLYSSHADDGTGFTYEFVRHGSKKDDGALRDISSAPKDRTKVLLKLHDDLVERTGRTDIERFQGIVFVGRHPGLHQDGFDIGWNFAGPVGMGGFDDAWIEGWLPLPEAVQEKVPFKRGTVVQIDL
jgi:hypothetical protein